MNTNYRNISYDIDEFKYALIWVEEIIEKDGFQVDATVHYDPNTTLPANTSYYQACSEQHTSAALFNNAEAPQPFSSSESNSTLSPLSSAPFKKRGRPAKPLISHTPSIDDEAFRNLSPIEASHMIMKIKNNESSRKYRRKTKSKLASLEQKLGRLLRRHEALEEKKNRHEREINILLSYLMPQTTSFGSSALINCQVTNNLPQVGGLLIG